MAPLWENTRERFFVFFDTVRYQEMEICCTVIPFRFLQLFFFFYLLTVAVTNRFEVQGKTKNSLSMKKSFKKNLLKMYVSTFYALRWYLYQKLNNSYQFLELLFLVGSCVENFWWIFNLEFRILTKKFK